VLLEDFVLREKIFHFDHERIPERIVHARGSAAHGYFEPMRILSDITKADLFQRRARRRRSSPASPPWPAAPAVDTPRDVRGFAVKFYTQGRQLGSGRQQHPGVLHPGRDQVSRPDPLGEDGGRRGYPQAAAPTTPSGTSSA
jgi:catalase